MLINFSFAQNSVKTRNKNLIIQNDKFVPDIKLLLRLSLKFPSFQNPREINWGHTVAQLVEALLYKPEGSGFDSR